MIPERNDCDRARKLIPLHSGGDLPEGKPASFVKRHVRSCASCRELLDEYHETRRLLSRYPSDHSRVYGESLREEIMKRIAGEPAPGDRSRENHEENRNRSSLLPMIRVAALLLLGIGLGWGTTVLFTAPGTESAPPLVENEEDTNDVLPDTRERFIHTDPDLVKPSPGGSTNLVPRSLFTRTPPRTSPSSGFSLPSVETLPEQSYFLNEGRSAGDPSPENPGWDDEIDEPLIGF